MLNRYKAGLKALLLGGVLLADSVSACQTAMVPGSRSKVMGKNYVWDLPHGRLMVNRKNLRKFALVTQKSGATAANWVAKYPSLTFNQTEENFPNGGINSAGLAIEILLAHAEFPDTTQLEAVSELQWIQYLLDTSATVEEATLQARKVDIVPLSKYEVHYHVCDKTGACAVFEYAKGKLNVFDEASEGKNPVGANNSCFSANGATSYKSAEKLEDGELIPGLAVPILPRAERMDACAATRRMVDSFPKSATTPTEEVSAMFRLMQGLSASPQWQIVYELANQRVHFRTQVGGATTRSISLSDFDQESDLDCRKAYRMHSNGNLYVRPQLRFNLNGKRVGHSQTVNGTTYGTFNSTKVGGSSEREILKRADFSTYLDNPSLLQENKSFFERIGISQGIQDAVYQYPATHTSCTQE